MKEAQLIPNERIIQSIFVIRGQKVMFDKDLAILYGVKTKVLNQAVKRNLSRFSKDFMFQLTIKESENLKSQFMTSSFGHGGKRKASSVFTEQGILMLSSILKSERAIQVNIQIVRTFIKLREMLSSHKDVREKIEAMEKKYDQHFKVVFDTLKQLLTEEEKPKRKIGFSQK
ncbi:MAG: ORF6N domain-containing protein [Candidatus Parcubacteria bacterium]|nr:ORF6N domain-containing protein [Candidatus Parcubacteria bacterium]